jgi:hypothetical protein
MWMTAINFVFRSKGGQAMLAFLIIMAVVGGYKIKISSLENDLNEVMAEKNNIELKNNICEADLGQVKFAVSRQNKMIDELKAKNEKLAKEAEEAVKDSFTPPAVIKRVMHQAPGHVEMNKFMEELEGGLS